MSAGILSPESFGKPIMLADY